MPIIVSSLASFFGRAAVVVAPLANTGNIDTFVVKYDSGGTPVWARRLGGTNDDRGYSVTTDSSGNVIVTGYYSFVPLNIYAANGTTVSFTLTNTGNFDAFVVKYDSAGTPLWARKIGGTFQDNAYSISTDSSGNIVVTGQYFSNPLNIYAANGTTVSFTLTRDGTSDCFVVKYDSSGTPLWARRLAGTTDDYAYSVSTDSSGNIVVAGYYASTTLNIYAANGTTVVFTLSNSGSNDCFVVKYDSSGTPVWARRLGGTLDDIAYSVRTDSSGNVIVTGQYFSNPLNIYAANGTTVTFTLANTGSTDAFVVKYDSAGTPLWARRLGGTNTDLGNSVSTDSSGNIVVTGYYSTTSLNIYAANGTTVTFTLAIIGGSDIFVVKYDSAGTPLWARRLGGTSGDTGVSVSTDSSGNIVVAGYYQSTLNIYAANGTTVSFTLATTGSTDAFVVKYDSAGTPLWARKIGGTLADAGETVSVDSSANVIVIGYYSSNPLSFS
jgi:plastocyanin